MSFHFDRVFLIVMDSVGSRRAARRGHCTATRAATRSAISRRPSRLRVPTLRGAGPARASRRSAGNRIARRAAHSGAWPKHRRQGFRDRALGNDGHRAGAAISDIPDRVSRGGHREFERRIGRATIGNTAASGTAIIDELGPEHMRTGAPIVYTSADSVFQIAAHEDVIPIDELYRICRDRLRAGRRRAWASAA